MPVTDFEPGISALCEFYANLVIGAVAGFKLDSVVRVLSSSEKEPDALRPQSLLADAVCRRIGARNFTHLFFKSESRPPMRTVEHLSGPEALKNRIRYAAQNLFIKPFDLGGTVLLIDDIMNTGASMRVYAHALKSFAGVDRVIAVNLAATRFNAARTATGAHLDLARKRPPRPQLCGSTPPGVPPKSRLPFNRRLTSPEIQFIAERKSIAPLPSSASPTTQVVAAILEVTPTPDSFTPLGNLHQSLGQQLVLFQIDSQVRQSHSPPDCSPALSAGGGSGIVVSSQAS